jgi:hypothetical protein
MRLAKSAKNASLQGERLRLEEFQFHASGRIGGWAKSQGDERIEESVLGGGDVGGLTKGLTKTRVVVALKRRQQFATHAIAEKLRTEVGGVLAKWLSESEQVSFNLRARGGEQGTDEARRVRLIVCDRFLGESARIPTFARGRRMWATRERMWWVIRHQRFRHSEVRHQVGEIKGAVDSGEPAGSGAAEQTEEDRLGLIVTSVGGGYTVESVSGGGALEKCVPGTASGGFEREMKERSERGNIIGFDD